MHVVFSLKTDHFLLSILVAFARVVDLASFYFFSIKLPDRNSLQVAETSVHATRRKWKKATKTRELCIRWTHNAWIYGPEARDSEGGKRERIEIPLSRRRRIRLCRLECSTYVADLDRNFLELICSRWKTKKKKIKLIATKNKKIWGKR